MKAPNCPLSKVLPDSFPRATAFLSGILPFSCSQREALGFKGHTQFKLPKKRVVGSSSRPPFSFQFAVGFRELRS